MIQDDLSDLIRDQPPDVAAILLKNYPVTREQLIRFNFTVGAFSNSKVGTFSYSTVGTFSY